MKLLICLGNPEAQYNKTRHNIGFWVADAYAAEHQLTWHNKDRFKALVADAGGYLVVKPTTYYNLAGESTRALADFYKVEPNDILVVHDDLALPLGTLVTTPANSSISTVNKELELPAGASRFPSRCAACCPACCPSCCPSRCPSRSATAGPGLCAASAPDHTAIDDRGVLLPNQ